MEDVGETFFIRAFQAAVESTVEDWAQLRDEIVAGFDDPAEVFAASY